MGELEGIRGAWGYPEGGMGAVSGAIAKSALAAGAEIYTSKEVRFFNSYLTHCSETQLCLETKLSL